MAPSLFSAAENKMPELIEPMSVKKPRPTSLPLPTSLLEAVLNSQVKETSKKVLI